MRWALLLLILGAGCADTPAFEVDAPLWVFNTYPANGATIARSDLGEVSVTFSADLGEPAAARAQAAAVLSLAPEDGTPLPLIRPDGTNVAYDRDDFTLRVVLDDAARAQISAGPYVMRVDEALTATDGRALPTALVIRFTVALR